MVGGALVALMVAASHYAVALNYVLSWKNCILLFFQKCFEFWEEFYSLFWKVY